MLDFTFFILRTFGFNEFEVFLFDEAEGICRDQRNTGRSDKRPGAGLKSRNMPSTSTPVVARFYGPKIDIKIKDAPRPLLAMFNRPDRLATPNASRCSKSERTGKSHRPS